MSTKAIIAIGIGLFSLIGIIVVLVFPQWVGLGPSSGSGSDNCPEIYNYHWVGGNKINSLGDGQFYAGFLSLRDFMTIPGGLAVGDQVEILDGPYKGIHPVAQLGADDGTSPTVMFVIPVIKTAGHDNGRWKKVC